MRTESEWLDRLAQASWSDDPRYCGYDVEKIAMQEAQTITQYFTVLSEFDGDVVFRMFACRKRKNRRLEYMEVQRIVPGMKLCLQRNMYLSSMSGWKVVYSEKDCHPSYYGYYGYNFNPCYLGIWTTENIAGVASWVVNIGALFKIEKYKYCGWSGGSNLFRYLELYNEFPEVEYFGKLGIIPSKALIQKAKKDKQFVRFLIDRADEYKGINSGYLDCIGPQALIYAYENNIGLNAARWELKEKREVVSVVNNNIKQWIRGAEAWPWLRKTKVDVYNYVDYIKAAAYVGLDMKDPAVLFPQNFKRAHDLRVDQYNAMKGKAEAKKKREFNRKFEEVAKQCQRFSFKKGKYEILIPNKVKDLVHEGHILNHCVGRMGYDQKMIDGRCVIGFVRLKSDISTPFVTVEWLTSEKKVSQRYGNHDSRPSDEVIAFIDKWEAWMQKLAREEEKKLKEALKEEKKKVKEAAA